MNHIDHIKELMDGMEPLAPELQRFLGEAKSFIALPALRHPLIYRCPSWRKLAR